MSDMMNNPEQMSDLNRNRFFRQFLFLGVLIAIGVVLFRQLNFFVGAFLGAITIYIVLRNVMFRMVERHGFTRWVAALLLVMATALVLAGFGWISVRAVSSELSGLKIDGVLASMNSMLDSLNSRLGMHIIPEDIISRSDGVIKSIASGILNTTYSFTANIFMMLLVLYFMLTSGRHMESRILAYSPFTGGSLSLMQHEVKTMIYMNWLDM